jgi:hypothetical protein
MRRGNLKRVNEGTTILLPYASARCQNAMNNTAQEDARNQVRNVTLAWCRRAREAVELENAVGSSAAGTCDIWGTPMLRRMWLGHRWIPLVLSFACRIMASLFYHWAFLHCNQCIKYALHLSRAIFLCLDGMKSTRRHRAKRLYRGYDGVPLRAVCDNDKVFE